MKRDSMQPEKLADIMMKYLDCPCRYFAPMKDDDPLMEAYSEARERGKKEGFTPVIVAVEDILAQCIIGAVGGSTLEQPYAFERAAVDAYRGEMRAAVLPSAEQVIGERLEVLCEDIEELGHDFSAPIDTEAIEAVEDYDTDDRFHGYWDFTSRLTCPVILAEIPTDRPWEIFAWLPFGDWNECPGTETLMAVSKKWYEQYGAVPVVMTHDVLEYALPRPVRADKAMELVKEQYAWCPDCIDSVGEDFTPAILGAILTRSKVWSFWWD